MYSIYYLVAIFCFLTTSVNCNSRLRFKKGSPIIGISNGFLHGKVHNSRNNRFYYGFRGIPFAEAPVRFQDSVAPKKWEKMKSAADFGPSCPYIVPGNEELHGDENCLFLNVYFPKGIRNDELVPVIMSIGGNQGEGRDYEANYFMDEDVVLVTTNYRTGALGFLNTGDDEVSGNMGMNDLVMALKWVQKEIHIFGGDPNKVTILGQGTDAAAVHYLILSPLGKGLFHNAISQSGTALNPFAFNSNPMDIARRLGEKLDCTFIDSTELVQCMRDKNMSDIISAEQNHWSAGPVLKFTPTIDTHSSEPFLQDKPYNLIVKGRHSYVPWIVGGNDDEGLTHTQEIMINKDYLNLLKNEWNKYAPDLLQYRDSVAIEGDLDKVSEQIWNEYFSDNGEITTKALGNLLSDRLFWLGYKISTFYHSKSSKTFAYVFGATTVEGKNLNLLLFSQNKSVGDSSKKSKYESFSKSLVKLWVSFAKTGAPTETLGSELEWRSTPPSRIGINAPLKWYYISPKKTKFLSDDAERLSFWYTLPLTEFTVDNPIPIKDEF